MQLHKSVEQKVACFLHERTNKAYVLPSLLPSNTLLSSLQSVQSTFTRPVIFLARPLQQGVLSFSVNSLYSAAIEIATLITGSS